MQIHSADSRSAFQLKCTGISRLSRNNIPSKFVATYHSHIDLDPRGNYIPAPVMVNWCPLHCISIRGSDAWGGLPCHLRSPEHAHRVTSSGDGTPPCWLIAHHHCWMQRSCWMTSSWSWRPPGQGPPSRLLQRSWWLPSLRKLFRKKYSKKLHKILSPNLALDNLPKLAQKYKWITNRC